MGVFLFSIKMLKKEYKKAMIYAFTMMFTIMACFIFFNIMANQLLASSEIVRGGHSWQETYVPITTMLAFLVIIFCCAMIIFANHFFLSNKTKELAIMSTSGLSFLDLTLYIFYQTIIITVLVMPIGLLLGYLFSVLGHTILYSNLNIEVSVFQVSIEAFVNTFFSILSMIFSVLLYSSGYIYRHDIQFMLSTQTVNNYEDKRIFKLPKLFYIMLYFIGIVLMIFSEYSVGVFIFPCLIGIAAAGGVMSHVLPNIFSKLKQKKFVSDKIWLISISNLSYSLKKSITLVSLYSISSAVMSALLVYQQGHLKDFLTIVIGYIVIIILLSVGIFYKYSSEIMDRQTFYYNLYKLGYVKKQMKKIISKEVISYYGLIIFIPLIYIIIIVIRCCVHGNIGIFFGSILIAVEMIPPIFVGVLTYHNYKNIVLKAIEGGIHYE